MWKDKMVSVVVTSYHEKDSIRAAIEEFFDVSEVDEVVVVDNNAEPGSIEEVKKTKARLLFERRQGHGWALQCGLREAKGEYIFTTEGDGTFEGADIKKFLFYADNNPVVFGTRTNKGAMEPGALGLGIWGVFRRWADIIEAKIIELLFQSPRLTDVGCTFALVRRNILENLSSRWIKGNSYFVTEMRLQAAAANIPYIEIPIIFKRRRHGRSYVVDTRWKLTKEGIKMFFFILYFWCKVKIIDRKQFTSLNHQKYKIE